MKLAHSIEIWPLARIKPYERNARTHSAAQVAKIAASIAEFGFNAPILVDGKAGVIAGHGRLMAARELELTEVPVIVLDHLSDAQRRAYILADNKLAEDAGWDAALLALELTDLDGIGFDLDVIGFSDSELAGLLDGSDFIPAEPAATQSLGTGLQSSAGALPQVAGATPHIPATEAANDPHALWEGMPEFRQDDLTPYRQIIVSFASQQHVDDFQRLVMQSITDRTRSIWYPEQVRMDTESRRYGT